MTAPQTDKKAAEAELLLPNDDEDFFPLADVHSQAEDGVGEKKRGEDIECRAERAVSVNEETEVGW